VTAANRPTEQRADDRTANCAANRSVFLRSRRGLAADRVMRVLTAAAVIDTELVEALRRSGQRERARAGRYRGASRKYGCGRDERHARGCSHEDQVGGVFEGTTCSHGVAHCCT
jgi:hypothetical protein